MYSDRELFAFLPSKRKQILAAAIGRRLEEIQRLFSLDLPAFLEDGRFTEAEFFSNNTGSVQMCFENGLTHVLDVWGEQLSIVVLSDSLQSHDSASLYRLTEIESAPATLTRCIGQICQDVRIWTLQEEFESSEAKEAAVSYVLENGEELFYCIYLHEDLDSDFLLPGSNVPRDKVAGCISLAGDTPII